MDCTIKVCVWLAFNAATHTSPESAEWESRVGDASSPLFPSCTKFPLPSRSWLYVGSIITQLTTTSLHSDKNTNWWPVIRVKEDFQTHAFRVFFLIAAFNRARPALSTEPHNNNKNNARRAEITEHLTGYKPLSFSLTKNKLMKGCRTLLVRTRQVSLKAPRINLDTVRAPFKEQEDPFPSDDWYFTFHTINFTCLYSPGDHSAATLSISNPQRNAEIKAFMSGIQIETGFLTNL